MVELIDEDYQVTPEADRVIRRWLNKLGWSLSRRYEVAWNAARELNDGKPDRELVAAITGIVGEYYEVR